MLNITKPEATTESEVNNKLSTAANDLDIHAVWVTGFKDESAQTKSGGNCTLPDLCALILKTNADSKEETPWLKLALFGNVKTVKGCLRHDANVTAISGIEVDYDDEKISFGDAVETMRKQDVRCIVYTSASHRPDAPRWRILVPLSERNTPENRAKFVARINGMFDGRLAGESFTLSTAYHYGSVAGNPHHRAVVLDGMFLDVNARTYAGSIDKYGHRVGHKDFGQVKAKPADREPLNEFEKAAADLATATRRPADQAKLAAALAVINPDCGWVPWYKIGCALRLELGDEGEELFHAFSARSAKYKEDQCATKWSETEGNPLHKAGTIFYLATLANPGWKDQYEASVETAVTSIKLDAKPRIQVIDGELDKLATKGEELLLGARVPLYQRAGMLVRPIVEIVDASHGRKTKVAQLKSVEGVYLRDLLCRHGEWVRWDGRANKLVPMNPPTEIATTMLGRVGEWGYSKLAGVIATPTMRNDGTIFDQPGYDAETQLLLIEPPPMPPIPSEPTFDDAMAAVTLLDSLIVEFPFIDDIARAVALAAMITPVVRAAFTVAPLFLSNAPVAGSGKSYLWDTVSTISIGQLMPVMAAGRTEEETEKRLGAALLAGRPLISIDNITGELSGDALCQMIERPTVTVRILGKSEDRLIESRGTSFYGSGNNLIVRGDLTRRSLMTTLDPRMERPELRQFNADPISRVLENRGLYIAAALTICKAYIAAGRPNLPPRLASFEGWSDTVRGALMWLGKADCVLSMELTREDDPERNELSHMIEAWSGAVGVDTRTTLATIIKMGDEPEYLELATALAAAAFTITGQRGRPIDLQILGKWMRGFKGRVVDGRRFENKSNPKGGSKWWVEKIVYQQPAQEVCEAAIVAEDAPKAHEADNEPRF